MIAIKAIYDGQNVKLPESVHIRKPQDVIVTFLKSNDYEDEDEQITASIAQVASKSKSFD